MPEDTHCLVLWPLGVVLGIVYSSRRTEVTWSRLATVSPWVYPSATSKTWSCLVVTCYRLYSLVVLARQECQVVLWPQPKIELLIWDAVLDHGRTAWLRGMRLCYLYPTHSSKYLLEFDFNLSRWGWMILSGLKVTWTFNRPPSGRFFYLVGSEMSGKKGKKDLKSGDLRWFLRL